MATVEEMKALQGETVKEIKALLEGTVTVVVEEIREAVAEMVTVKEMREAVAHAVNTAFEAKLKIGEDQRVNLPKMERQVDNLFAVAPDVVQRGERGEK
jgi:hypothetical protein